MKFSVSVTALVLALPLLAQASPAGFGGFGGGFGGQGAQKGAQGNKGAQAGAGAGAKGGAAAASAAAASAAAASAAAASAAAAGGNNQAGGAAAASAAAASAAAASAAAAGTASAAAAAGTAAAAAGAAAGGDPQTSTTLDPAVIASGFAQNGQAQQEAGQVASLTSTNNFINFCLTTKLPITNGQQIVAGSCNPAPMGVIAAQSKMPSSKFTNPVNGQVIQANTAFTISMAIQNLQTGNFVNPNTNYFSAPQQVDGSGNIIGHSHVVIDTLQSLTQTQPTDPTKFAFFKGLNAAASGGVLTADVTQGLPAGTYRLSSINTAANHQPALVAVAQHGALDDQVYFTVTANGQAAAGGAFGAGAAGAGAANATAAAGTGAAAAAAGTSAAGAASATAAAGTGATGAAGAAGAAGAKAGAAGFKGGKPAAAAGKGGKRGFEVRRSRL
ncbi:hypothetical protein BDY19DRAFT_1047711 [Irpex rosettiformis]|uniref:Uncharacterized protein n=1 Tax=Irpex rosettiformis TaxID=378272 RepID=A0ACB8U6L5_9APHY|nr:hypothetical protein BDY19DRAFT_1047711 [Irpex rosettiformis]